MSAYPLLLDLAGRRVVVVGGGRVGARRAASAVDAGAEVVVVDPTPSDAARDLPVRLVQRRYASGDLDGAWLVHAATDAPAVNAAVAADADRLRVWCVRADDAAATTAAVPAVGRVGDVVLAVGAGGDPRRARELRDRLTRALHSRPSPARGGWVALVGGGPGSPDLVTVRGQELLERADVVVADRLGPRGLLERLRPGVRVIDVGKAPGAHRVLQPEINRILVEEAKAGAAVVRLKGGDPFVLGRGGEEALACIAAGVPVEVVPGVTSAIAVPSAAGIPLTHRGVSQSFAVISGHLDPLAEGNGLDWGALAAAHTIVLLMAVGRLPAIADRLMAAGRSPGTPVAVVREGTLPDEDVVITELGLVEEVRERLRPPAVIVIGEVVRLREQLHTMVDDAARWVEAAGPREV